MYASALFSPAWRRFVGGLGRFSNQVDIVDVYTLATTVYGMVSRDEWVMNMERSGSRAAAHESCSVPWLLSGEDKTVTVTPHKTITHCWVMA